ncbi:hypothetical protein [Pseudofrankia asymbiotica]|uniref:Uncharacterized protein n=1 Tax=Pseudofrankia asymbiotica TaxID=1834516 RepID=A0A1V2I294_9ACTN|nr:hypothetical protein [Pseudofrankia asymbiotica]ONH23827.1 hypothetical protein BL253_31920 [Pseudofrankia asymbiotica]
MELLILLYFAYAVYRAGLDAAVRSYALARGRDVTIGEGDRQRHYAGWAIGAGFAVFFRSLWEGWRVAWPWSRDRVAAVRARRAARGLPADDWDDEPDTASPDDDPDPDPDGDDAPTADPNDPDGDGSFLCARCRRDISDPETSARSLPEGWVCGVHFPDYCAACGQPAREGDPLVVDHAAWIHRSHLDPDTPPPDAPADPAAGEPAEVVDEATGEPVDAVWETPSATDLPAADWTKVHHPAP